ncbi:MAG TPA: hypothetical protein VGQ37_05025 [Vicinamibacterales bacterium]|jgi:hypothetical protein|nr:hypothetical protein [Vicinamibacterales bacterium]
MRAPRVARAAALLCLIGLSGACSDPKSIFESPSSPLPTPSGPAIPVPVATIVDVTFEPRALSGGASGTGTAILTVAAPAGGLGVQLSASDGAVTVPALVTVPAGASRATFPVSSGVVGRDASVSINAAVDGRVVTRTLAVYAVLPTFLTWFSDAGDWVGSGDFGRLTTETATFTASGSASGVDIRATGGSLEFWSLSFTPVRGGQLRVGTYENATRSAFRDNTSPGLDVSGRSHGCNTLAGRFEVLEADFSGGQVRLFRARFQQHCENGSAALIGEVRFTSGAR